jgi:Fuc2NAc and GlcNAc transferase
MRFDFFNLTSILAGAFGLSILGAYLVSKYAYCLGLIDSPNCRSSHSIPTPRGGGVGLLLAFIYTSLLVDFSFNFYLPIAAISIISFLDDFFCFSPKQKLLFQFLFATLLLLFSYNFFVSFQSLISVIFWIMFLVGTANFYNFMDGVNGISGISGSISFAFISLFSYLIDVEPSFIVLSASMSIACVGFLPFNFPKAKVFMGDIGSVLLGFLFGSMVYFCTKDFASFVCLISFSFLFYADTLVTIFIRFKDGECLSQAHRRHLYQLLSNELNFPHWQVSSGYGVVQLIIGVLMLAFYHLGVFWQCLFLLFAASSFIILSYKVRLIVGAN